MSQKKKFRFDSAVGSTVLDITLHIIFADILSDYHLHGTRISKFELLDSNEPGLIHNLFNFFLLSDHDEFEI